MTAGTGSHSDGGAFKPNPEQAAVIDAAPDAWLLVVAGPGTGKTQVAAMRLAHLIRSGLLPAQILVLSFSRSAVATLTRRIAGLQPADGHVVEDLRHLAIRTFDSWAFRILRQCGAAVPELLSRRHDDNIVAATSALGDESNAVVADRLAGIRHVIVDEFQDLPGVRADMVIELLSRLNADGRRVGFTVLGDPVQSIYRWAARASGQGAPGDPWERLKTRMARGLREVSLTRNHRATEKLASMAASLRKILQSEDLTAPKKLAAMQRFLERIPGMPAGTQLGPDWLASLPAGSVAILTRTNGEALRVVKMLLGDQVEGPAVSVRLRTAGETPSAPAWIAALLWRFKPQNVARSTFETVYRKTLEEIDPDARAALNMPSLQVCWARLARASGASEDASAIDMEELRERLAWPDSFPDDQTTEQAAVYITTVHQAKGMEFDNVSLLDPRARKNPKEPEDPLELANVGFVAVTRAGRVLNRIPSDSVYAGPYDEPLRTGRSRFAMLGSPGKTGRLTNFQLGLSGDIDPQSLVDAEFHGGAGRVTELQQMLAVRAAQLRGHKVILKRLDSDEEESRMRDARWEICLQEGAKAGRRVARTTQQVTDDLLAYLWNEGLWLPNTIFNLRIGEIVTLCARGDTDESVPEPWRSSRLWLGITLFGTGDFKTWKRNGK